MTKVSLTNKELKELNQSSSEGMKQGKSRQEIEFDLATENGGNRIMPTGNLLTLKKADYQVYAWLQANCLWGSTFANEKKKEHDDWGYIYKDSCSSRYIASFLNGTGYSTVQRALKNLEELGLIISSYDNKGDEVYILPKPENIKDNAGNYYVLIPSPLLRFLSNTKSKETIKFYCKVRAYTENYFRNNGVYGWWYENLQDMATSIGLGTGPKAEAKIADIIADLESNDLITVKRRPLYDKNGKLICANKYFVQARFQESYAILDRSKSIYNHQRKEVK